MTPAIEAIPPEVSQRQVLKGSLIVGAGLFLAQLAGFVRQVVIGYLLGTGAQADALSAAMAPVELWWSVLAVTVVFGFAPKFSEGRYAFGDILKPLARLSFASTLCIFVFADPLIRLFAPGLDAETTALGAGLLRVFSIAPAAVGCSFVYTALLFSRRKFTIPSLQHAVVNVANIAGALLLYSRFGVYSFAIGYVAGAWIQLAMNHFSARRIILKQKANGNPVSLRRLLSAPAPILGQSLALELNTAVTRAYASTFGAGMTAAFEYGFKLFRVPMALLVVPLSESLLPEISSRQGSRVEQTAALRAVKRAAWLTVLASLAVTALMMLTRRPVVSLLFERGEFGRASTEAVAVVLLSYMPVMAGRGLSEFLSRALFGMQRYRTPLLAALVALALNFLVCLLLPAENPLFIGLGAILGFAVGATLIVWHVVRLMRDD